MQKSALSEEKHLGRLWIFLCCSKLQNGEGGGGISRDLTEEVAAICANLVRNFGA